MNLSDRIETLIAAAVEKYREELDQSGVVAHFTVTVKVNERQQPITTLVDIGRRYSVEGTKLAN